MDHRQRYSLEIQAPAARARARAALRRPIVGNQIILRRAHHLQYNREDHRKGLERADKDLEDCFNFDSVFNCFYPQAESE